MDFELSENETTEIQVLNAKIVTIKSLIKEVFAEGNNGLVGKLTTELAQAQIDYDGWFDKMQTKFNVATNPAQRWNVDFKARKLQLLG